MTKTTKTANYFTINFIEKIICGSPASFKKASTGEGAAYEELLAKITAHPDYRLHEVRAKKNPSKNTYEGLTYEFMKAYITIQPDAEARLKKMELVTKTAKQMKKSAYPVVKKWFLKEVGEDFDMDEAQKAVNEVMDKRIMDVEVA